MDADAGGISERFLQLSVQESLVPAVIFPPTPCDEYSIFCVLSARNSISLAAEFAFQATALLLRLLLNLIPRIGWPRAVFLDAFLFQIPRARVLV